VHVGVINYLAAMEVSTIVLANIDMVCASRYDPSGNMSKCALIIAIDRERRCVFPVYISVELE
jgi:hypothetical protein